MVHDNVGARLAKCDGNGSAYARTGAGHQRRLPREHFVRRYCGNFRSSRGAGRAVVTQVLLALMWMCERRMLWQA